MSFSEATMWVMAVFMVIGGVDRIIGNKFGLGEKFEEGFQAMGPLALAMVGMVCLSPVISDVIAPVIAPAMAAIGADPAIFGAILPNDTGGYPLAMSLAVNEQAGLFSGLVVASMLGSTVVFSIPVGLGMIEKKDQPYFAKGLLIGMITIPIGSVIGGAMAGYDMGMVLMNTLPVLVISVLLAVGLKFIPNAMTKGCIIFGRIVMIIITIGLVAAAFQMMTGIVIIPGMAPIEEALGLVGYIAVVLLGTFPLLHILTKVLDKPLNAVGRKIGMDSTSAAGLVFSLANSIPVFAMFKNMSSKGKIVNMAWMVCSAGALGDHLGFTAGVHPEAIGAVVISKLIAAAIAVVLAMVICKNTDGEDEQSRKIEAAEAVKMKGAAVSA